MSSVKLAVYPGTFDPITLGHLNIIERASRLFDRLVVAVGVNSVKEPWFTPEERCEMIRQAGELRFNDEGGLVRGTVIRHLVLPGCRHDSMRIMEWIAENTSPEQVLVSIMNQYTPFDFVPESFPELKRRVTKMEYNSVVRRASELGLEGFTQEKSSADAGYVPDFDLSGL